MDSYNPIPNDDRTMHPDSPAQLLVSPISPEDPENFYRTSPTNPQGSDLDYQSNSPADSQAPIMASWRIQDSINEDPQSHISAEVESRQDAQGPNMNDTSIRDNTQEESQKDPIIYFPPPLPPPPSAGYVNGEVIISRPVGTAQNTPQFGTLPVAPLSAGLKTGGTVEEQKVAELDEKARIQDRKDLAIKLKVRLAKVVLRSVSCACSLVVLALVASTFAIFYATRHLPLRNKVPAWSPNTPQWPQILILIIACTSLLLSLYIMYSYWSGGHNKAERVAMHATIFTFATFIVTICIWSASIGIMQGSRSNNNDKDLWGWSCKDNVRKQLFQDTVNYDLVCRQQDWVIVCAVIEISLELLIVAVYLFAFYRIVYSKRKLRKSLSVRDEARSSLWLAKLQSQKDEDIAAEDRETTMNTTYNQLNSNTAYINAEEGCAVPILKAPPLGHHYKRTDASEIPSVLGETTNWSDVPPTPRSVNFTNRSDVPPTPRSVCFQELPRPVTSGSRER